MSERMMPMNAAEKPVVKEPTAEQIYQPGHTPWELADAEAQTVEGYEPTTAETSDRTRSTIGNLTQYELHLVRSKGDFDPVIKRIEFLPKGTDRDQLIDRYEQDISMALGKFTLQEEEGDAPEYVAKEIATLTALQDKIREYYSAE